MTASVNRIKNSWRHLKPSINGTHVSVSAKRLNRYVTDFEYRFNRRNCQDTMLSELRSAFLPLSGE